MENLFKEVAFLAYHFHWDRESLLEMSHRERHIWVKQVSAINEKINSGK